MLAEIFMLHLRTMLRKLRWTAPVTPRRDRRFVPITLPPGFTRSLCD